MHVKFDHFSTDGEVPYSDLNNVHEKNHSRVNSLRVGETLSNTDKSTIAYEGIKDITALEQDRTRYISMRMRTEDEIEENCSFRRNESAENHQSDFSSGPLPYPGSDMASPLESENCSSTTATVEAKTTISPRLSPRAPMDV